MALKQRVIPILSQAAERPPRLRYDCAKCPAYCCSYALIEVSQRDIARLARHFGVSVNEAEHRYTKFDAGAKVRSLRHQKDEHYGQICRFLNSETRRCTVYDARPGVCRQYPEAAHCGYYEFLKFEREHQGDGSYVATT